MEEGEDVSYVALYRKFRPENFNDVKGQDAIVATLKNQILTDHIGHAYLFCGTRGTGKTSVAKLFAKAVNCADLQDGNPCGKCASCKAIAAGASMNVIEIDAASNNGVDNIREIIEEVSYSPTEGNYRVYIIDEVHMLSAGAFNALLKTLEEPPSYVIFILATTEVHKIPVTIKSRCQQYDFKRIGAETIVLRLKELMDKEKVIVEEKALEHIARTADGSLRDALSLLDQCLSFACGTDMTYEQTLEILGTVDMRVFSKMLHAVEEKNVTEAILDLEDVVIKGRELTQFVVDFTWYLRNLMMVKADPNMGSAIDTSKENIKLLIEDGKNVELESIMRYIRIFSDLSGQIKYSAQKRILTEVAIIKLCKPSMETDVESILERVRELEKNVDEKLTQGFSQSSYRPEQSSENKKPLKKPEFPKAIPEDIKKAVSNWGEIVGEIPSLLGAYLKEAKPTYMDGDQFLTIVFQKKFQKEQVEKDEDLNQIIRDTFVKTVQKEIDIKYDYVKEGTLFTDTFPDLLAKAIHMDIQIEES